MIDQTLYQQTRRAWKRANGICINCPLPAKGGRASCEECLNKAREHSATARATITLAHSALPDTPLYTRISSQQRYYKKRQLGICVRCPKSAATDRTLCPECASKVRKRMKRYYQKNKWAAVVARRTSLSQLQRYKHRKALGLCVRCPKVAVEGKSMCDVHLNKARESKKAQPRKASPTVAAPQQRLIPRFPCLNPRAVVEYCE